MKTPHSLAEQDVFERKCHGKDKYANEGDAWAAIRALMKYRLLESPGSLMVYPCDFCDQFHFGHR